MHKSILIYSILFFLWVSHACYGSNYRFQHLTSMQGLPNMQVESLAEDDKGNIWIGTRNGLAKYDGYSIYTYYHEDNRPNSLRHNFIHHLFFDSHKRLWICTEAGICRYRPETDDFECYRNNNQFYNCIAENQKGQVFLGGDHLSRFDEKDDLFKTYPTLNSSRISSLAFDKQGNLFVASSSSVYYFNSSMTKITQVNRKYYENCLTEHNIIMPLFFDSAGKLWLGRNGQGLMWINLKTGKQHIFAGSEISDRIVRTITEDKSHNMWIGTEKGITIIHPNGEKEILRYHFQDDKGLSDNAIYTILCDKNQNIWIGSYFGGVDVLIRNNAQFLYFEPGLGSFNIKARVPRMMVEVSPKVYWIATEDGGINIYNATSKTFSVVNNIPNLGTNVHALFVSQKSHDMWIGTRFNGLFRYNLSTHRTVRYLRSNGLSSEGIFYIAQQHNGRIWVATMEGLRFYDAKKDYFFPTKNAILNRTFVYTLFVDKNDDIWVGTVAFGIFKINGKNGNVTNIRRNGRNGLKDNYIINIYQDSQGTIWIGTNNNGLQYIDKKTGKIRSFKDDFMLTKCTICGIAESPIGCLWISTSQGLYQYNLTKHSTIRFSSENGLPINQFNYESILTTASEDLLLGTINGLIAFNPKRVTSKEGPFIVHFKELAINNKKISVGIENSPLEKNIDHTKVLKLKYDEARSFFIEYGVIIPGNTTSIRYQVWVKGIDSGWRNVGIERRFYGYKVQPGTYYLQVRANNSNYGWDHCPVKTIKIVVLPPFYRSIWAYLIYFTILGVLIYLACRFFSIRMQERNAVKMAKMEKEKIEEIDRVKFNFFTTVSHELKTPLSLIVAPLKSISHENLDEQSINHLNMAIKNTRKMEGLINELVTFNKVETDNFTFYVQKGNPLEFIELASKPFHEACEHKDIQFSVDCENNGEEVWFSPSYIERIINNLLSNALKFTDKGGKITIKAFITSLEKNPYTYLIIKVSDTGIGIAKEEQENIFDRYYQTKRGYNVNNKGWGIGLALVKRLVEIHKGKVSVKSEIGAGSIFTVSLNVSPNAFDTKNLITNDKAIIPASQYQFSSPQIDMDGHQNLGLSPEDTEAKRTLLIVEDNVDMLNFLENYFRSKYNIFTATNGKKAFEIALKETIDLVISDVMMPEMDGIELSKTLKKNMETSHIPIILLTAKNESSDVVIGYQSGAEAYVSKPFDPQILELQVKNIISLIKNRQEEIVNLQEGEEINSTSLSELDKEFIHKINTLVDENIDNSDFAIVDITKCLGVSRSLLHTKMKNLMNISMGDYIKKKRIDKACQLLKQGYNVSETAYRTGFSDPNYFSKAFKKAMGISPSEFCNHIK